MNPTPMTIPGKEKDRKLKDILPLKRKMERSIPYQPKNWPR